MFDKRNLGLFLLRVGLGLSFMLHGWPKLAGGEEKWEQLGGAMSTVGVTFLPTFWGFMAAITEFFGGLLLVFGVLTLPTLVLLSFTMIVATAVHVSNGDPYSTTSHPLELVIVFLSMLCLGPGRYTLKNLVKKTETYKKLEE